MCNRFVLLFLSGWASLVWAQDLPQVCPRPHAGSAVTAPVDLFSTNGRLAITLSFRGATGPDGLARYCYVLDKNAEAPTLRLQPGDELALTLKNDLAPVEPDSPQRHHHESGECAGQMTAASTNLHFHGLNIPPTCHQDEVIHTLIQPGEPGFEYRVKIPSNQPPGLYWYHPHPHGFSEEQLLGGASGALIVQGIERVRPDVAGLPERVLVLRDQAPPGQRAADSDDARGKDLSLNFVPVASPLSLPSVLPVRPSEREFWRVLNASADTFFDLQFVVRLDGQTASVAQPLELVALDGAPLKPSKPTHILLPAGGRAEFLVTTPPAGAFAQVLTRGYDTGPDGERTPARVIANVISRTTASPAASAIPASRGIEDRMVTRSSDTTRVQLRKLYLSEDTSGSQRKYFITAEGSTPKAFDMSSEKPDIIVKQGSIEDWTIENRAREAHSFHIHQLHFQVMERNGTAVDEPNPRDTIELPYWDGTSKYPTVTLRMDFRDPVIVGTFLYHCHILEHEDAGMMGSIQVLP